MHTLPAISKTLRDDMASQAPRLSVTRHRLSFRATSSLTLDGYAGSTWRGAFGHALRESACVTGMPQCGACPLLHSCAYAYIFESPLPPESQKMRLYPQVPHPYVLTPPQLHMSQVAQNEKVAINVTLIGRATEWRKLVVHALAAGAWRGLGAHRIPLQLTSIEQWCDGNDSWRTTSDLTTANADQRAITWPRVSAQPIRIALRHPLRLRIDNRDVHPQSFTFSDFFASLLRRISMLQYFHTASPLETDFAGLVATARSLAITNSDLRWHAWNRYSSRQQKKIAMDGIVGSFDIDLSTAPELWPYIWIGQWIHAGKGAVMGLGKYQIEAPLTTAIPHAV